jgi:TP901 family phage tail tape measure protein
VAINSLGLGITLSGKDQISGVLGKVGSNLGRLQGRTQKFAKVAKLGFAAVGAGIGILAGVNALAAPFGRFDQTLTAVGAVTRATADEMLALRDAAIEAGKATQFSPQEAAQGLQELATAGQTAEQAVSTLTPVLDLAAGSLGQLGVGEAAAAVVGTLNAFGKSADDAAEVTDKLLRTTQLSNFQARDFAVGLSKAAAAGGEFGQSLDDTLIVLGQLRNRNIDASSASTAFREAIRRLGSDQRAQQAVTSKGIDIFDKSTGAMRALPDILGDMAEKTKDMTAKERQRTIAQALGARGMLAFSAVAKATFTKTMEDGTKVMLKGAEAIEALRFEMEASKGTAEEFKNKLLSTFAGQKQVLGGVLETLAVVAGEPFAAALKPMVSQAIEAVNSLIKWFQKLDPETKSAISSFVIGAGVFLVIAGAIVAAVGAIGWLITALGGSTIAWLLAGTAATGAAAAIGGSTDESSLAAESFGSVLMGLKSIGEQVWQALQNLWIGIEEGFGAAMDEAQPAIDGLHGALIALGIALDNVEADFDGAGSTGRTLGNIIGKIAELAVIALAVTVMLGTAIVNAWNEAEPVISPVTDALSDLVDEIDQAITEVSELGTEVDGSSSAWQTLGGAVVWVVGLLANILGPLIKGIGGIIASLAHIFGGVINIIAGLVEGDWSRVWLGVKQVVFGIVKAIISVVFGIAEAVAGVIDSLLEVAGQPPRNIAKNVDSMKRALTSEIQKGLDLEVPVKAKLAAAPEIERRPVGPQAGFPDFPGFAPGALPVPTIMQVPSGGPQAIDTGAIKSAATAAAVAAAKAAPARLVSEAQLIVDGQALADIVTQYDRDGSERAAADVSTG